MSDEEENNNLIDINLPPGSRKVDEDENEEIVEPQRSPKGHCVRPLVYVWNNRELEEFQLVPEESIFTYEGSNSAILRLRHDKIGNHEIVIIKLEKQNIFINHELSPNVLLNGHCEVQISQSCRDRMLIKLNHIWVIVSGNYSGPKRLQKGMLDTYQIRRNPGTGQMSLTYNGASWWSDSLHPCLIGSHHQCDFRIKSDHVLPFHAVVYMCYSGVYIEDLSAGKPGILLDGHKCVGVTSINKGQTITIGSKEIVFDFKGNINLIVKKLFPKPIPTDEHHLLLTCLDGSEPSSLKLGSHGESFTLGRSDEVDFRLEHSSVSRRQALIYVRNGYFYIEDLNSANGTWVNSKQIKKAKAKAGDIIEFGDNTFLVTFAD